MEPPPGLPIDPPGGGQDPPPGLGLVTCCPPRPGGNPRNSLQKIHLCVWQLDPFIGDWHSIHPPIHHPFDDDNKKCRIAIGNASNVHPFHLLQQNTSRPSKAQYRCLLVCAAIVSKKPASDLL
eukprot:1175922-Prorocentrum_minimum.AAC.1